MQKTSDPKRVNRQVVDVIGALSDMSASEQNSAKPRVERVATRWSTRLLIASGVGMGLLVVLVGIHRFIPLPRVALIGALGLSAFIQVLSLGALLLQVASGIASAVVHYRSIGRICQSEVSRDYEMATRLASYPAEALEAADRWLEQKVKRMERRQVRFFGGSDKLAVAVLVAAAWATWKEVGPTLLSWQPSPLLFAVAFLLGLAIGGTVVSQMVDRFNYQRDLLQIAKSLAAAATVVADDIPKVNNVETPRETLKHDGATPLQ